MAGAVLMVCAAVFVAGGALGEKHRVQAVAELAALAGADVAVGAAGGYPCEEAGRAAVLNGVSLDSCEVDAQLQVVSVSVSRDIWGVAVRVAARAGPGDDRAD